MAYPVGKCPECGDTLTRRDIRVIQIRTTFWRPHFTYVCRKCDSIIGFGTNAAW